VENWANVFSGFLKFGTVPTTVDGKDATVNVFQSLSIPRSYLNCLEDTALPPGEWGWHPRMSSRLGLYRLVQMRGGHEVVFTNPAGLALALIEAGRD
jgi:hypothetical protein